MEVGYDPRVLPDQLLGPVVGVEREAGAFADVSYRRESRGFFIAAMTSTCRKAAACSCSCTMLCTVD
jgi:hypothetical protein